MKCAITNCVKPVDPKFKIQVYDPKTKRWSPNKAVWCKKHAKVKWDECLKKAKRSPK